MALLVDFNYLLSTRWAVPSGQKTFSPKQTWEKRRLHSKIMIHTWAIWVDFCSPTNQINNLTLRFDCLHNSFFNDFLAKEKGRSDLRRNDLKMAIHHQTMGVQIYHHREYAGSLDTASCTSHLFCKLGVSSDFWSDGIRGLWRNQFLERK